MNSSRAAATQWVSQLFKRRRSLVATAILFNVAGPVLALLVSGALLQIAPSATHEFGDVGYLVDFVPGEITGDYLSVAEGSSAYCDSSVSVDGIAARLREVEGRSAARTVGLEATPASGEIALSSSLASLAGVSAGDVVDVDGTVFTVSSAKALNPEATGDYLAVTKRGESASVCTVLLAEDNAQLAWEALAVRVGENRIAALPAEAYAVEDYAGTTELRALWGLGTLLAVLASTVMSAALWGLLLPAAVRDGLSLVALGVTPRDVRSAFARRIAGVSLFGLLLGLVLGLVAIQAAGNMFARSAQVAPRSATDLWQIAVGSALFGAIAIGVVTWTLTRRLNASDLAAASRASLLRQPTWRPAVITLVAGIGVAALLAATGSVGAAMAAFVLVLAFRGLAVIAANRSRRLALKNFARSVPAAAPAVTFIWFAGGVCLFVAMFATIESQRTATYPDLPDDMLIAAAEWDFAQSADMLTPSQAPEFTPDVAGVRYLLAERVGDGTAEKEVTGLDASGRRNLPAYVASEEFTSALGFDSTDDNVFVAGEEAVELRFTDPPISAVPVGGPISRYGPQLFIDPDFIREKDVPTFPAAIIAIGPPAALDEVAQSYAQKGIRTRTAPKGLSPFKIIQPASLALFVVVIASGAGAQRWGLRNALGTQSRQLLALGRPRSRVSKELRQVAILSAATAAAGAVAIGAVPLGLLAGLPGVDTQSGIFLLFGGFVLTVTAGALSAPQPHYV